MPVAAARTVGASVVDTGVERLRSQLQAEIRRSMGMSGAPRPAHHDPAGSYFPPGSMTRQVHADLPAMMIGGVAALLFQMLHPLAMIAVAEHSNYRKDPHGRLARTADFLALTTFGSRAEAEAAIANVKQVHRRVVGVAPDGRRYAAYDPALLCWVHACEVHSFLAATQIYGARTLTRDEQDRYLEETAQVALDLGAHQVPRSMPALHDYFEAVRPELRLTREASTARNFVLRGVRCRPDQLAIHLLLAAAAQGVLPRWARRQLHLASLPGADRLAVQPPARALSAAVRWVISPPR